MKYRGYYIDHVVFNSKSEIDTFVKQQAVRAYEQAVRLFCKEGSIEASMFASEKAEVLNKQFGLTWSEVEAIEIQAMENAA